jgi:hypothetical protein
VQEQAPAEAMASEDSMEHSGEDQKRLAWNTRGCMYSTMYIFGTKFISKYQVDLKNISKYQLYKL